MNNTSATTDSTPAEYAACAKCAARGPLRCDRCGCYEVSWRKTNAGRWYLMAGNGRRAFSPPHKCESHNLVHSENMESHEAYFNHHRDHTPVGR